MPKNQFEELLTAGIKVYGKGSLQSLKISFKKLSLDPLFSFIILLEFE